MFAFAAIGTTLEGMRNAVFFIDVCNLLDRQRTTHLPYSTELLNGLFSKPDTENATAPLLTTLRNRARP